MSKNSGSSSKITHTTAGPGLEKNVQARTGSMEVISFVSSFMKLMNNGDLGLEVYGRVLDLIIDFFNIKASAIRLKLGEDYPFFVTRGFSERFLEKDNFICSRDSDGNVFRGEDGDVRLKCFCGAVISQDRRKDLFTLTEQGIFCAHSEADLSPGGKDLMVKSSRIKCCVEGFSSVCLIPVRSSMGISGLIVMADTKPIVLTQELQSLLEVVATGLGSAFDTLLPPTEDHATGKPESDRLLESIFDLGPTALAVTDTIDYRFTHVNDRFCEMLGYSREELSDLTILDVTHPDDIQHELRLFEEDTEKSLSSECHEKRFLTKDRKTVWGRVTECALGNYSGKTLMTLAMVENIDDLKLAHAQIDEMKQDHERKLRSWKSEIGSLHEKLVSVSKEKKALDDQIRLIKDRFRAISQAVADLVFFKNTRLRYTYVNPEMEKLFGLQDREILGKKADDFFSAQSAEQIRLTDLKVLAGEKVDHETSYWINGSRHYFNEFKLPLKDSNGKIKGVLGLVRNVTGTRNRQLLLNDRSLDYPSATMRATMEKAAYAAQTDSIVLLEGESGSGKDHIARWIHERSKRSSGPFLGINCAALPHELAESELFGHEQGAFTGARGRKRGLLELAEGGTLLLNEIGELSLTLQTKLLTFLDTRSFMRVGGEKSIKLNARIMAATHRDLTEEVAQGRFERSLFYRLNVFSITIPPLRDRLEDMEILVHEMINKLAQEIQLQNVPEIGNETLARLSQYDWPGNVRELRNVLERGLLLSRGSVFTLPAPISSGSESWSLRIKFPEAQDLNGLVRNIRVSVCNEALRRSSGNRTRASQLLGISRDALYRYLKSRPESSENNTTLDPDERN